MIIELSAGFMLGVPSSMFNYRSDANLANPAVYSLLMGGTNSYSPGYGKSRIALYKGTVPTDLTTLSTLTSRDADMLVYFDAYTNDFSPSQLSINPSIITTVLKSATATGTATWLRWYVFDSYTAYAIHQIVGTVGSIGSGMDLEMDNPNLVTGTLYRITNMRILFPTTFTCS